MEHDFRPEGSLPAASATSSPKQPSSRGACAITLANIDKISVRAMSGAETLEKGMIPLVWLLGRPRLDT